jgi:putative transposase
VSTKTTKSKGTTTMKNYQTEELDAPIVLPTSVSVAMADIAGTMREGLLAMAVGAGLAVMQALMEESVTEACGPKGKHDPARLAARHGAEHGSVTLGGRRVSVRRPRVRAADGSGEVKVPA